MAAAAAAATTDDTQSATEAQDEAEFDSLASSLTSESKELTADERAIADQEDPQVAAEQEEERQDEKKAQAQELAEADTAEAASKAESASNAQLDNWLASTPSRQAAYATAMHTAPILAILTALGGRLTRQSGFAMLGATTGIIQGLNAGAEQKYTAAYNQWMAQYQVLKEQHDRMLNAQKLMLEAYAGRADAYQKAADAARRQTGDMLSAKQQKLALTVDTFKAQTEAMDRLARVKYSLEATHDRNLRAIAQAEHWKQIDARMAGAAPATKAQAEAIKQKYTNAAAQVNQLLRQRGQISSDDALPTEVRNAMLQETDDKIAALQLTMDQATSDAEALASAAPRSATPPAAAGAKPNGASPPANNPPGVGRSGVVQRPGTATPQYQSADEVRAAYNAGALTKDQAAQILREQFGFQ